MKPLDMMCTIALYRATRVDLFLSASDIAVTVVLNIFLFTAAFLEAKTIQKIKFIERI